MLDKKTTNDFLLENMRKEYAELYQGGDAEVRKRIEKWKESGGIGTGGAKPTLDHKTLALQIQHRMIGVDVTDIDRVIIQNSIYNYLLDRSFECKLLEYELDKLAEKRNDS